MRASNGFLGNNELSNSQMINNINVYQSQQEMHNNNGAFDERDAYSRNTPLNIDKKQLRHQNPTNLSSESSIYRAGKNVIGQ